MDPRLIFPNQQKVSQAMRSESKGHSPLVLWLTGLSGSGKSTIANALEYELATKFRAHTYLLDGDNIRAGLNADLGFSDADRTENIRRIGQVSRLMYDAGLIVITALISPFRADRNQIRSLFEPGSFWEIFVSCPLEVCRQRDPKNLYAKAADGSLPQFTGINSPYEEPLHPEMVIDSSSYPPEACVNSIISKMRSSGIIHQ
jgi:adenylyl-sulfate kinase